MEANSEVTQATLDLTSVRSLVTSVTPLARALEINPNTVYRWIKVNRFPGAQIVRIANFYNVDLRALLPLTGSDKSNNNKPLRRPRKFLRALLDVYCGERKLSGVCQEHGVIERAGNLTLMHWGDELPTLYTSLEQHDQGRITTEEATQRLKIAPGTFFALRAKYGYAPGTMPKMPTMLPERERDYAKIKIAVDVLSGKIKATQAQVLISNLIQKHKDDLEERIEAWKEQNSKRKSLQKLGETRERLAERKRLKEEALKTLVKARREAKKAEHEAEIAGLSGEALRDAIARWERLEKQRTSLALVDTDLNCSYRVISSYTKLLSDKTATEIGKWPRAFRVSYAKERWNLYDWRYNGSKAGAEPKEYTEKWLAFAQKNDLFLSEIPKYPQTPESFYKTHINRVLVAYLLGEMPFEGLAASRKSETSHLEMACTGQLQVLGLSFEEVRKMGIEHQTTLAEIFIAMMSRARKPRDFNSDDPADVIRAAKVKKALQEAQHA
jgi:hypothetical protein